MPNNLTGNYDAVLLVRVKTINAILATLHQNGADEDASPTCLHTAVTRLGGRPPHPHLPSVPTAGIARVQLSAPAISLAAGSTSEVMVHVHARAHYTPDAGTFVLPAPIHGEVRVVCLVAVKTPLCFGSVKRILEVILPQQDSKIQFHPAPGTGLTPSEHGQLLAAVRKAVRENFEPVNTEIPSDFPFPGFKELGGGQVLAVPISLTAGQVPPVQDLNTVTNNFVIDDFAAGISRNFVEAQLKPTFDSLRGFRRDFSNWWTTYRVRVVGVELEWKNASLTLIIRATAKAARAPDYNVTIRQKLTLAVNPISQRIILGASNSDLSVSLSGFGSRFLGFVRDRIRSAIIPERDKNLPQAEELINTKLTGQGGARSRIQKGLQSIDPSAGVAFSSVRIAPDGLILDGRISTHSRSGPVISFEETRDGLGFTALESWVPGGRIRRFRWSWVFQNPLTPWGGDVGSSFDDHGFILPKPSPPRPRLVLGEVCLRIEGLQTGPQGNELAVTAGRACSVRRPDVVWRPPKGMEMPVLPIWDAVVPPDGVLKEAISGHVNLAPDHSTHPAASHSLVHFADPRLDRPLTVLAAALAGITQKTGFLAFIVVPEGAFNARRRELEARLGSVGEAFPGHLILTEDYRGAWKRGFGVERLPATVLLNRDGAPVWKQEGVLDGEGLAKAVDEFFVSGRPPRFRMVGIARAQCDRFPGILLSDDRGQTLALRKLRGHRVLLNFWRSWSLPSLQELQRFQKLCTVEAEDLPVIVAVNGGEPAEVVSETRRKFNLEFALVPDPEGAVSRQFGIECWPSTLSISPEGKVDGVQFGKTPEYTEREGMDEKAGAGRR